jgi:PIN domain nuclease of toxin-antitoxin system
VSETTAVVVDTHTLVWYVDGDPRLSPPARQALDAATEADLPIIVSPISLLEVSYLADRGKVAGGTGERLREVLDEPDSAFEVYPIDLAVILAAIAAPWQGGDPSDRILAGTATTLQVPLVTRDEHLRQSEYVDTLW